MIHPASLATTTEALRSGRRSTEGHLGTTRSRVEAVEPEIESLLLEGDRWERLEQARDALQARYATPGRRPPLYGAMVGVKDIFHAAGFPTKAGSDVPPEDLAGPEASSVTRLTEAGALVLGKTVTTEFAFYDPGPTRNPHDTDHTPGGSSSGSAAAVAAGLCPLALGTQTIGSICRPAAFCGIVGVKPSYGRVPTDGVIPLAPSVDHIGFFTQDMPSARLGASVLYPDWGPVPSVPEPRLGAVEGPYLKQADEVAVECFEHQLDTLRTAGYQVRRLDPFPDIEAVNDRHHRLVAAETAMSHNEWYPAYENRYGPKLRDLIETGHDVTARELGEARAGRTELRASVEAMMAETGVDVLLSPSAPGTAPEGIEATGDPVMNLPWTHSGLPTVSLPAGTLEGLPLGLQCAARYEFDEWLLEWAEDVSVALNG